MEAAGKSARVQQTEDELAKAWLVKIIERTSPGELGEVPLSWIATEAPPLIADVLDRLGEESAGPEDLPPENQRRVRELTSLRGGDATRLVRRDLAALQAVLIESLAREVPPRGNGEFSDAVERLAEIFGGLQAAVVEDLAEGSGGDGRGDEVTGLPGAARLQDWLRILLAEYRRYAHPFSVLLVDIDGLERINQAYGREVGDRMLGAVGAAIEKQVRGVDQAFRLADGKFSVLVPHQVADRVKPLADRLTSTINAWQRADGPRVTVTVGVASCPEHGHDPEALLEAAEHGAYAAKADGRAFAVGTAQPQSFVQDPNTT